MRLNRTENLFIKSTSIHFLHLLINLKQILSFSSFKVKKNKKKQKKQKKSKRMRRYRRQGNEEEFKRTESTKTWRGGQKPQRTSEQLSQTEFLYSMGLHQLMILQIQTFKRVLQRSTDDDTTSNTLDNYIFNLLIYQLL